MAQSALQLNANALTQPVNQTAHGFTNVGTVVRLNAGNFVGANNTNQTNASVIGMIYRIENANQFYVTQIGFVSGVTAVPAEGGSFIPYTPYYLSATNGLLTAIRPVGPTDIIVPAYVPYTTTSGFFFGNLGYIAAGGGSGANTALSNLTPTAINESLIPGTDDNIDLGSFDHRYAFAYPIAINTGHAPGDFYALTAYNTNTNVDTTFATATAGNPPTFELEPNVTGATQAPGTSNTTLATTAFVDANAANKTLSNLNSPTAINQHLLPGITVNYDLGSPNFLWSRVYPVGLLTGTDPGDTMSLVAYDTNLNFERTFITFTAGNPPTVVFDGDITSVTQTPGTNTTQLATCAFVQAAVSGSGFVPTSRTITINGTANEITSSAGAQDLSANRTWTLSLPSALTFTGKTITGGSYSGASATTFTFTSGSIGTAVTAVTQTPLTNNTTVATTAYVDSAVGTALTATVEVTGTSQALAVGTTYIMNNAALVTGTLPTTAIQGAKIRVLGKGAGGWKVAQNASQAIQYGAIATTTGTGGSLASQNQWDGVELVCLTANTGWAAYPLIGNLTTV